MAVMILDDQDLTVVEYMGLYDEMDESQGGQTGDGICVTRIE